MSLPSSQAVDNRRAVLRVTTLEILKALRSLGVPRDMLDRYVEMFIHMGLVERISGGLVVPGAVFTSAEMMSGANEAYDRIVGLISALRGVGFSLGENIS